MKPKEKQIFATFKHMLEQRVHLSTFALFGSRARGDAGRYSDMDVLVVVDQLDSTIADYISDCAWESGFGSGIVVVPVSYQGQNGKALRAYHCLLPTSKPKECSCETGRQIQYNWLSA